MKQNGLLGLHWDWYGRSEHLWAFVHHKCATLLVRWYQCNWRRRRDIGIHLHQLLFSSGLDWSIGGIASVSKPWICKRMFSSVTSFKIIETLVGGVTILEKWTQLGRPAAHYPYQVQELCRATQHVLWVFFFEISKNNSGQGERTPNCQLANAQPCSKIKGT